jgi:hypothetical protein
MILLPIQAFLPPPPTPRPRSRLAVLGELPPYLAAVNRANALLFRHLLIAPLDSSTSLRPRL